jgi:hypothetical protein
MASISRIPKDESFDSSLAALTEGYNFIRNRCRHPGKPVRHDRRTQAACAATLRACHARPWGGRSVEVSVVKGSGRRVERVVGEDVKEHRDRAVEVVDLVTLDQSRVAGFAKSD